MGDELLSVQNLHTYFHMAEGVVKALNGVSFSVGRQKTVGIVGESGCGKSVTARSILRLVQPPGKIVSGSILYYADGDRPALDLVNLPPNGREIRAIRGRVVSMIFQEPMTCLSPVHTVGNQIIESIRLHDKSLSRVQARDRGVHLLGEVGMPRPDRQIDAYSFELSGGMRQRAMIAVALSAGPKLLIADEPTTAVDVTIQARILQLLRRLQVLNSMSILFISHDLGVISKISDDVVVMYLGIIVEKGPVKSVYFSPKHPYTQLLLECAPGLSTKRKDLLTTIEGVVPDPRLPPPGCPFSNRCPRFMSGVCDKATPESAEIEKDHHVACYLYR